MAGVMRVVQLGSLGSHGVEIDGVKKGVHDGGFIKPLGDINSDGLADFNVSSGHLSNYSDYDMILYGGTALPIRMGPANCDGIHGFKVASLAAGWAAGDFNGDGVDDMVFDRGGGLTVFSGSILYGDPDRHDATVAIPTVNGSDGVVVGQAEHVALGDVNGDGFDDVINLTAGVWNGYDYDNGRVSIALGAPTGKVSLLNVSSGREYGFGRTVSALGDINGDGFADFEVDNTVVFGASGLSSFSLDAVSSAQGFYEGRYVKAAGDVNRDGVGDLIVDHTVVFGHTGPWDPVGPLDVDGSNGFMIVGTADTTPTVSAAGDVNGDGFDDILVGDYLDATKGEHAGAVYIIYGGAQGWQHQFNVSTLDDDTGFKILGARAHDHVGMSIPYGLGDVNGDGIGDIAISAPDADVSLGPDTGAGYVVYGLLPDVAVRRMGTPWNDTLAGGDFNDKLSGRNGDDVLWGHGGKDVIQGADGDDLLRGGDGKDNLAGGAGEDTLIGGEGRDRLAGGDGADVFTFQSVSDSAAKTFDSITDLEASDVIDLSAVDADAGTAGDQGFHLVASFSKHAGELTMTYVAAKDMTVLQGDTDGNGKADFAIHVIGQHTDFTGLVL